LTAAASAAKVPRDLLPGRLTTPALALTLLLAACGGTSKPAAPATSTPAATSAPAADLAPLLVGDGVLPGFKRTGADPVQQSDAEAWAATNQEPDASQLKALGFVAGAREDLVGPPGAYALNLVERFRTAADAHKRLTYTARDFGSEQGRFRVSGVPGAVGFESGSGSKRGRSVAFSKGDTVFLLSHQVSKRTPSVEQLKDAIRKWYAAVPR
jgi:hypothetical protein